MKKLISMLLALCMVLGMSGSVFAVEDDSSRSGTWGGIDWTLSDVGTLTISPTKGEPVADQNAPTKRTYEVGEWREAVIYDDKGVGVAIEGWPYELAAVKKLVIKEGVTSIGSFTAKFPNLTGEVVIPSTVTYIGQEAFQNAPIEKLTFAKGGTEALCIAPGAFKNLKIDEFTLPVDRPEIHVHCWVLNDCTKLEKVTFPANITTFSQWTHVEYMGMDYVKSGDSQVLARCSALETLIFGSDDVKTKFYAAPGNTNNINAIGNVYVDIKLLTVAKIGETYHETLADAVAAAKPGDTITLLQDTKEAVELPAGVTLDKKGFAADNVTIAEPDDEEEEFYEEEPAPEPVDDYTAPSDMEELISELYGDEDSVSIELVGEEDTIAYKALRTAAEAGVAVELDGRDLDYFWRFEFDDEEMEGFRGLFRPFVEVNADPDRTMKKVLNDVGHYLIFHTTHEGDLPDTATLGLRIGRELRAADALYLYYWNEETKQAEEMNVPMYMEGYYLCMELPHCSTYILTDTPIEDAVPAQHDEDADGAAEDAAENAPAETETAEKETLVSENPATGSSGFVGAAMALALVSLMGAVAVTKRK